MGAATMPMEAAPASRRDLLWGDCRNSLGIARLLVHEGRPEALVATACRMAVESACRAALEQMGRQYDGDLGRGLRALNVSLEAGPLQAVAPRPSRLRLLWAEGIVGGIAALLREAEPARSWSF